MADNILDLVAREFPSLTGSAEVLTDSELETLRPFLNGHPNHSDQRLLATIHALKHYIKRLRIVRP